MKIFSLASLMTLSLSVLAGCAENVYFSDDEGGPRATSSLGSHPDELSLPYALDTKVNVTVRNTNGTSWTVVSDTPAVFSIDSLSPATDGSTVTALGHALAEGSARIRVLDDKGAERRSAQVTVQAADRARLFAHADLRVLGNDNPSGYDSAEVTDTRILAGGKAVLAVAYYHGQERVYGRGLIAVDPVAMLTVEPMTTSGAPTNEFLFVTPAAPGSYQLVARQGTLQLASLAITAVDDSALVGLSLAEEQGASKDDKSRTWVAARARDASGREVLGVYCDWTLDGAAQAAENETTARSGDLYRYHYDATGGPQRTLSATHGTQTASVTLRAHDGYVSDTTYLGCSLAPGGAPRGTPGFALLLLLVVALGQAIRFAQLRRDRSVLPGRSQL